MRSDYLGSREGKYEEKLRLQFAQALHKPIDFRFRIADSVDDIVRARNLVASEYANRGYFEPNTKNLPEHQCHPTSLVVLAERGKNIIGTFSIIMDSEKEGITNLPIEEKYPRRTDNLRRIYSEVKSPLVSRIAEISGFVSKDDLATKHIMNLISSMTREIGIGAFLALVSKTHADIYQRLWGSEIFADGNCFYSLGKPAPCFGTVTKPEEIKDIYDYLSRKDKTFEIISSTPEIYQKAVQQARERITSVLDSGVRKVRRLSLPLFCETV